jgi:DNA-binding CsgD family transcriptional regulator
VKRVRQSYLIVIFTFFFFTFSLFICYGQVASRTDGVTVHYYDSLFEAAAAVAAGGSIDSPDEITLLTDVVLDEPLIVDDGVHIKLVAGNSARTIRRSANLIEYPVVWVRGDSSSLTLGKPGMEYELIIDGGRLNNPPIEAHTPLAAVSGPDSKLIMYDKVTLQNNINTGNAMTSSYYQNGGGVFIRAQGDIADRQAEFIMKGGTIRGNINDSQSALVSGGAVLIYYFGIFTMEGGVIMNNIAANGGGFFLGALGGSFKKTGGIIYGSNAPAGYRNTSMLGTGTPQCYGHAVAIAATLETLTGFRDDTVGENDNLSFTSSQNYWEGGIFGKGEKWDNPDKALLRMLAAIILPIIAVTACVVFILRRRYIKRLAKEMQEASDQSAKANPKIDLENMDLSGREKDICELLLTDRPMKEIGQILGLTYSGANFHAQKLYTKLGIENRTELLVRVKSEK